MVIHLFFLSEHQLLPPAPPGSDSPSAQVKERQEISVRKVLRLGLEDLPGVFQRRVLSDKTSLYTRMVLL